MLSFIPTPDLGTIIETSGQRYQLDEVEPYIRRDGSASILLRWRTTCADCGIPFEFRTGSKCNGMNRRCSDHARPGSRVDRRKGGKRKR